MKPEPAARLRPLDLAGIAALAALLRAWHLVAIAPDPLATAVVGDSAVYVARAHALLEGRVSAEYAFTPPLYPVFLAAVFALAGEALGLVRGIQAAIGVGASVAVAAAGSISPPAARASPPRPSASRRPRPSSSAPCRWRWRMQHRNNARGGSSRSSAPPAWCFSSGRSSRRARAATGYGSPRAAA